MKYLDDDLVLDRITAALIDRPCTFSELFGRASLVEEPLPSIDQVEEALDVLLEAKAITTFREARHGERLKVFGLKSEARLYWDCEYCYGTGFQTDQQRGLCHFCHGNGVFTPKPGDGPFS